MLKKISLILVAVLIAGALVPASYAQDGDDYTYTVVGGEDVAQTYPDQGVAGIQFTDLTYRSLYPSGMEFKATITPPEGMEISRVTLFYTFPTGKAGRVRAEPGNQPNEWIAIL